jgi:hypothetical protein
LHGVPVKRLLGVALAIGILASASSALADGDPASDFLSARDYFTPFPPPSAQATSSLLSAIDAVKARGDRVKVAVIATKTDLGSVPSLYGQPAAYAKFLATELSAFYRGPLLVVMPAGFGFSEAGKTKIGADATLRKLSIGGPSPDALMLSAADAVAALERGSALHFKDTVKPEANTFPTKAFAGARVALAYAAFDDSGRAKINLEVDSPRHIQVARFNVPLRKIDGTKRYTVIWRVPARFAHKVLALCIQATDPAGNTSPRTCATLSIK